MAVATADSPRLTIDQLVLLSYQKAGLLDVGAGGTDPGWSAQRAHGRQLLGVIVNHLSTLGPMARQVVFYELMLVDGTSEYAMPEGTLMVLSDAMYLPPSSTPPGAETMIKEMTRDEWASISSKESEGRPTRFFADRGATTYQTTVKLWPVPQEAATVRFQIQRVWRSTSDGAATVDLDEHWMAYLSAQLAHDLALTNSLPLDRIAYLGRIATAAKDMSVMHSNQRPQPRMTIGHRVSQSGARR